MSVLEEPQRALMLSEATAIQRNVFKYKLNLGDKHMAILLTANSLIPRFYAEHSFQGQSHLVCAAASFLLAQKLHLCAHSIPKMAACFVDACLTQLETKHSVLLAQPMQNLVQLRAANIRAKKNDAENQTELRALWDKEHAAITAAVAEGMRLTERKLLFTIGFRNLNSIGMEWSAFQKVEDSLQLHSRPEWTTTANKLRDIDLLPHAAAVLSPRQVAVQFLLQSACSSQALEKFGPTAVALAAFMNAVNTKSFRVLEIPQGSSLAEAIQQKVDLREKTSESVVGECWRHVLRANQISKQQNQLLQAPPPAPVACHAPHSPPGPTKISPNVSNLSASTPLSRTPHKRCRSDDEDDPARSRPKGARTESPRTAQATPASQRWEQTRGIDAARRPEHEMHRHKASRRSPARRSSVKSPKTAVPDPPSPESLEEGELR